MDFETLGFSSRDTPTLARQLLGFQLVYRLPDGQVTRWLICETEAYDGPHDLACHASKGRTPRNAVMFGPAGHWYVYLCYGIHEMLNLVTGPVGYPAAILIRGVAGAIGPGRLTKQIGIDRRFQAAPAIPATGLWLEPPATPIPAHEIHRGPRIGIAYAGPEWAAKAWRFWFNPTAPLP